jgi:hypothetical protein
VTPIQAVSAGPRRAPRSILPLTPSSSLSHASRAGQRQTPEEPRGCRGADQDQRTELCTGELHVEVPKWPFQSGGLCAPSDHVPK